MQKAHAGVVNSEETIKELRKRMSTMQPFPRDCYWNMQLAFGHIQEIEVQDTSQW